MKDKIKIIRLLTGSSQVGVASKLKMCKSSISLKESGDREISVPEIFDFARALEVPAEIFFYPNSKLLDYLYATFPPDRVNEVIFEVLTMTPDEFRVADTLAERQEKPERVA